MTHTPLEWLNEMQVNVVDAVGSFNDQYDPQVVQLENGNVLVVWVSDADPAFGPGAASNDDLIGRIYDPLGNPVTGEIEINTNWNNSSEGFPAVTALEGGGFMVAYSDFHPSLANPTWAIRAEVFSNAGTNLRDINIETSDFTNEWTQPEIASISATSALVTYTDGGSIYGQIINPATGAIINAQFLVASQTAGDFRGLDVTALTSDFYLITYADRDAGDDELHYRLYNPATNTMGSQNTVANNFADIDNPSVAALDNGGWVLTWQVDGSGGANTGVRAAVYSGLGFNTVSEFSPATTLAGNQTSPEVVALDDNQFVIAWVDRNLNDIKGQLFDVNGNEIGSEFTIIDHASFVPGTFSMTRLEDGRFQVAWQRAAGSDVDVFTSIWDPREIANDPPVYTDNMVIGTPGNDTINPIPAGADEVYGAAGNDTFWVTAADVGGTLFDGGTGTDTLGILDTSTGLFGIMSLLTTTFVSVETLKFNAGGSAGLKYVFMSGETANGFATFDFAQGGVTKADTLRIQLSSLLTLDLSGKTILDFESAFDLIQINGDGDAETITGTSVNDTIDGGNGLDTLDGAGGFDTLSLANGSYTGTVTTNLTTGTISSTQGVETAVNFENFQGGSADDIVFGTAAHANEIRGGGGNDTITGRGQADRLFGEGGDDTFNIDNQGDIDDGVEIIDGGSGTDTIAVGRGSTDSQTYNLRNESITSIERIDFLGQFGGTGTDDVVQLSAKQFNDGDVSLTSAIDGFNFAGTDELLEVFMTSESTLDLSGLTFTNWGFQGEIVSIIGDVTSETITGTSEDDLINGNGGDDVLSGGASGSDVINGGSGNDQILLGGAGDIANGGAGNDTFFVFSSIGADPHQIDGGANTDRVNFGVDTDNNNINLGAGTWSLTSSGDPVTSILTSIENVTAGSGNDTITGSSVANILDGGNGNDTIDGGAGADNINGGSGFDTASFAGSGSAVIVNLAAGTNTGGDAQGDILTSIENLTGSAFDDTLVGDAGNNILTGGDGDDFLLDLSGGDDTFFGGAGNDRLQGSGGADAYDGGTGIDEVRYNNSGAGVIVDLNTGVTFGGDAVGDTFDSIENLVGSQFNDGLIGDGGINRLEGFLGDDILRGGLGADVLWGGLGFDTASYFDSTVGVDARLFGTGSGGTAEGDTMIYMEGISGSFFNDTLIGGGATVTLDGFDGDDILFDYSANATLIGGNGNDFMQGGIGGDAYDGGAGTDTVSFANAVGAVNANLATGTGSNNDAAGDTYTGIENLLGSANSDTFIGDGNDNNLNGQGGIDFLLGGLGNDTLTGGAGVDLFQYDTATWGFDIVTDFQNGTDFIDLRGSGLTFTDFTEVATGSGMRLDYTDGGGTLSTISLLGINIADIDAADFLV